MNSILCLIPARGGSKGIPNKNIVDLNGKPLIAYSIETVKNSRYIDRIVVATDSEEIAKVAKEYGAEVLMRPPSSDTELDLAVLKLAFKKLKGDHFVYLRPTTPIRDVALVDKAIEHFNVSLGTCLRSAHETREAPYKMFAVESATDGGEYFVGLYPYLTTKEYYNLPRQTFSKVYQPNGYVDIFRREVVEAGSLCGNRILAFVTPEVIEVDRQEDLDMLRKLYEKKEDYPIIYHGV